MGKSKTTLGLSALLIATIVAMAGSAFAAAITFAQYDAKTKAYSVVSQYGDVTSWDFAGGVKFTYRVGDKKIEKSIERKLVISATLTEPVDFSDALRKAEESGDVKDYQAVANNAASSTVQKDYAAWKVASISGTNGNTLSVMRAYLLAWPSGNFRRDALLRIAGASKGNAYVQALNEIIALGDDGSKAEGYLQLGIYRFSDGKDAKNDEAKAAFEAALAASISSAHADIVAQSNAYLGRITGEKKYYQASVDVDATPWLDLVGRDKARGYSFKGLGDIAAQERDHKAAYEAFVKASFWLGPYGLIEGECILGAYTAASMLAGGDPAWEARRDTLKTVLDENYPSIMK